jgi:DNA polymerase I-like protein with 3'-5' exonuclease and polymerase domains
VFTAETGQEVQIWAARSIAKVFDKLGLPYDRTAKTQAPSFTKNFLANHPHKIVQAIAKAREINKAHTTFLDTILKYSGKGRIHAEINQLRGDSGGTVTGKIQYEQSKPTADTCKKQRPWTTDQKFIYT